VSFLAIRRKRHPLQTFSAKSLCKVKNALYLCPPFTDGAGETLEYCKEVAKTAKLFLRKPLEFRKEVATFAVRKNGRSRRKEREKLFRFFLLRILVKPKTFPTFALP